MSFNQVQIVVQQIQQLTPDEQLEVIKRALENLVHPPMPSAPTREPRQLIYGEFQNSGAGRMSTEEDFKCAEWNPTDEKLNEY